MSTAAHAADEITVVPDADSDVIADVAGFLEAHSARRGHVPTPHFYLSGSDEHDRVEIDERLFKILKEAVEALHSGRSVSIVTSEQEVTTQQAAEFLGVSRPTVVRLIENGELPARVPGAVRRKLRLMDVLAYRDALQARRSAFIGESSAEFADVETEDVDDVLERARRAR